MALLIPGILTDNEEDYVSWLKKAEHVANLIQIDIVDGKFAPSKTISANTIKKHQTISSLEVQLMVNSPSKYIDQLADVDYVTRVIFPLECRENIGENIYKIKDLKKHVGISINPETPVHQAFDLFDDIDILCIFSANPGFSGKKLEEAVYPRIKEAKRLNPSLAVEVDIGVNFETTPRLVEAGADFLVATSALLKASDYNVAYEKLAKLAGGS